MKLLVVFALFVVACMAQAPEMEDKIKASMEKCNEMWQPAAEDLTRFRSEDFANHDNKMHCYTNCVLGQLGLWVDGKPEEAAVTKTLAPKFGEELVATTATKCNSVRGATDCESAFKVYTCYRENKVAIHI